jgi:hypothetical protein
MEVGMSEVGCLVYDKLTNNMFSLVKTIK